MCWVGRSKLEGSVSPVAGLDDVKGPTDWAFAAETGRMSANIDRVDISSKFLQKIDPIKDSIFPPQTALVFSTKGKGKRKVHPITGHESPERK